MPLDRRQVVQRQSWISANPGLKLLFWFGCLCTSVCFETLENKISIDPNMNCGKLSFLFSNYSVLCRSLFIVAFCVKSYMLLS
jgi:hypothetical protein